MEAMSRVVGAERSVDDEEPTELRVKGPERSVDDEEPTEVRMAEVTPALAPEEERSARGVEVGARGVVSDDEEPAVVRAVAAAERTEEGRGVLKLA